MYDLNQKSSMLLPYTGSFEHSFDEKGRITVPKEWRGEGFERRLLLIPLEKYIQVFPASLLAEKMDAVRHLKRSDPQRANLEQLATRVQAADMDPQHRIAVKEKQREATGLGRNAVLVGRLYHFELWDPQLWQQDQAAVVDSTQLMLEAGL